MRQAKHRNNSGGFVCSYVKQGLKYFFFLLVYIKLTFGLLNFIQNKIPKLAKKWVRSIANTDQFMCLDRQLELWSQKAQIILFGFV